MKDMSCLIICLKRDLAAWLHSQMFPQPKPAVGLPFIYCHVKWIEFSVINERVLNESGQTHEVTHQFQNVIFKDSISYRFPNL